MDLTNSFFFSIQPPQECTKSKHAQIQLSLYSQQMKQISIFRRVVNCFLCLNPQIRWRHVILQFTFKITTLVIFKKVKSSVYTITKWNIIRSLVNTKRCINVFIMAIQLARAWFILSVFINWQFTSLL